MPTDREIFAFFREQKWTCEMLSAMFREPKDPSVVVAFKTEELMKSELLKCPVSATFSYENGEKSPVTFAAAKGNFKYVRIFGLPIEVEDKHVAEVMAKYGKIQHMVRERYGADTGFPILNGVRGVHIELTTEIPTQIYVQHFQARVFYEGMKNKCFICGSSEHIKVNCDKRVSVNDRMVKVNPNTYAQYLVEGNNLREGVSVVESKVIRNVAEPCESQNQASGESIDNVIAKEPVRGNKKTEDDVQGKKRQRGQVKSKSADPTADRSRSSQSSESDDVSLNVKKVIVASGEDFTQVQSRRSRSRQLKKTETKSQSSKIC